MPELPEVETVVRTLEHQIKGATIKDIHIYYQPIVNMDTCLFIKSLKGQTFRRFLRRGKYLLFEMDDCTLVSHLRMEGKYYVYPKRTDVQKHTHVVFDLNDGRELHYNDVRKFGRFEIIPKDQDYRLFRDLGPEPLSEEFDATYFYMYTRHLNKKLKALLLEQRFVAGIGNIYADEIAFDCGFSPLQIVSDLSYSDCQMLVTSIKSILSSAVKLGGTTIRSYTSSLGVTGLFQTNLHAYGKKGEECEICHGPMDKVIVSGRCSHFCPNCQKERRSIAITGTIGSGKSTFCNLLRDKGYEVYDADKAVHALFKSDSVVWDKMKQVFPEAVKEDFVDRSVLAGIVFKDPKRKKELEEIVYPVLYDEILRLKRNNTLFIAEIPLLFETNFWQLFSQTLLIAADEKTIVRRMRKRGYSVEQVYDRLSKQMPLKQKVERADVVIYNDGDRRELKKKMEGWLKKHVGKR